MHADPWVYNWTTPQVDLQNTKPGLDTATNHSYSDDSDDKDRIDAELFMKHNGISCEGRDQGKGVWDLSDSAQQHRVLHGRCPPRALAWLVRRTQRAGFPYLLPLTL
jgi:hypothetical protein